MKRKMLFAVLLTAMFLLSGTGIRSTDLPSKTENTGPGGVRDNDIGDNTQIDKDLVAMWHFDEGKGSDVEDSSGNSNDGTFHTGIGVDIGQKWVGGIRGTALLFDGRDDYVDCGSKASLQIADEITVSAWVKLMEASEGVIYQESNEANSPTMDISYGDDRKFHFNRNTDEWKNTDDEQLRQLDTWYNIVGTYDGKRMLLYVNGVEVDSLETTGSLSTTAGRNQIGLDTRRDRKGFGGIIDEVSVHSRALGPDEIVDRYYSMMNPLAEMDEFGGSWFDDLDDDSGIEGGLGGQLEPDEHTVGSWHFDEGSGDDLIDASGKGNNGTRHDAVWCDGRFGTALSFSGDGQYAEIPDDDTLDFGTNDDFTVEVWFRTGSIQGGRLLYKISPSPYTGYILTCKGDGKLSFILYHNGDGYPLDIETNYGDNRWHMLAATRSGAECTVYYDGAATTTVTRTGSDLSNNDDLGIGSQKGDSHFFEGMIDEVRISGIARTKGEIARNYESGLMLRNGKVELNCSQYKRAITITNDGDGLTNYQVQVNLTTQNFDYSKAKSGGEDVRFTTHDGGKLSYWIEEWNSSGDSKIWVNVTNVSNGGSEIWMEYGNPNAESESDGEKTFDFFDDFEGPILDASKWTSNGVSITSGYAAIGATGTGWANYMYSTTSFDRTDIGYESTLDVKVKGTTPNNHETYIGFGSASNDRLQPREGWDYNLDNMKYFDAANTGVVSTDLPGTTMFRTYTIRIDQISGGFLSADFTSDTYTLTGSDNNMRVKILPYKGGGDVDNVRVRKYASPELTISIGPEQPFRIECYDDKTQVLTMNGWRYFKDVTFDDKIATLNPATGKTEWHRPTKYFEYDYSGEMYKITGDGFDLVVSPEHKVYCAVEDIKPGSLISPVVVNEPIENNGIPFDLEHQYETSNMNASKIGQVNVHCSSHHLLNSSIVIDFLPDLMVSSTELPTSLQMDSFTSRPSSQGISDISSNFFRNSISSISSPMSTTYDNICTSSLNKFSLLKDDKPGFLISPVMVNEPIENNRIIFDLEHQYETSDMNASKIGQAAPEIFVMVDGSFVTVDDLSNLFSDCKSKRPVLMGKFVQPAFKCGGNNEFKGHSSNPISLSSSSSVIGFLPDLMVSSTDLTTSLQMDSFTSRSSSQGISEISSTFFRNSSSSISSNLSEIAFLAMADQLTQSTLDIRSFSCGGTDNVIAAIFHTFDNNYVYYVWTNDINKSFGSLNSFSLMKIDSIPEDESMAFLDADMRTIAVNEIEKVPYLGKIYDVTVPNHILLVRRNGKAIWSGNSYFASKKIDLPVGRKWDMASVRKTEPVNTFINVSVIDASTNATIPNFANKTGHNIDLSELNDQNISSIRLKAYFQSNGSATPSLDSWGVEWMAENAWRDSFTGDGKSDQRFDVNENTMGYWRFEEDGGNSVSDAGERGNNGTLRNMEREDRVMGRFGNGVKFDGDGDHIGMGDPDDGSLDADGEFTIEAWIRTGTTETDMIISKKGDTAGGYYLATTVRGQLKSHFQGTGGVASFDSVSSINDNAWHHVAAVMDANSVTLYIDGILDSGKDTGPGNCGNSNGFMLGVSAHGTKYWYDGLLDEVRISDAARTPSEILSSYRSGISIRGGQAHLADNEVMPDESCVGLWHFNEGYGTWAWDSSGGGNDGAMTGTNWSDKAMGGALEFSGDGEHVDCGGDESLDLSGEMTISAWIYPKGPAVSRTIVSKANYSAGEGYYMILRNTGELSFRQMGTTPATIVSQARIPDNEWTHIAITSTATTRKIYINGEPDQTGSMTGTTDPCPLSFMIGKPSWLEQDYFRGMMDEVAVHDMVLDENRIRNLARFTHPGAVIRSEPVNLPEDRAWSTFHFDRSVPENTYLNISVRDFVTNEILLDDSNRTKETYLNLSHIDPIEHASIYLEACFGSSRTETSILYDWAVNRTDTKRLYPPNQTLVLPDIAFEEDTHNENAVNLSLYFEDINEPPLSLHYEIERTSGDGTINATLNGTFISFIPSAPNRTGSENFTVNCSNVEGLRTLSNSFTVTIVGVDDAPRWKNKPDGLFVTKGYPFVSPYSLIENVEDAENDSLEFDASCSDIQNLFVNDERRIEIDMDVTFAFSGDTSIDVRVSQTGNLSLFSNTTIPVRVYDYPRPIVELREPLDEAVITEKSITLRWNCTDPDTAPDAILFDLYFGNNTDPPKYKSDLTERSEHITGLSDNSTYYWKVGARDGEGYGYCASGTWSFSVNTFAEVPEVTLETPIDGTIINRTYANLTWSVLNASEGGIIYRVLIGSSPESLSEKDTTGDTWYVLNNLSDNTTYHWKVEPYAGGLRGRCVSGTWKFTICKGFIEVINISWDWDNKPLSAVKGKELSFNLTVRNYGNVVLSVGIEKDGPLSNKVSLGKNRFTLAPGNATMIPITLFTTQLDVGLHEIVLLLSFSETSERIEIPASITSGESEPDETSEKKKKSPYLVPMMIAAIIAAGIIVVVILIIMKKRKRSEEQGKYDFEEIEADVEIVHVPGMGPPTQGTGTGAGVPASPDITSRDARYSFKGRVQTPYCEIQPGVPPQPTLPGGRTGLVSTLDGGIDLSGLHLPSEPLRPDVPGTGEQMLALPPARFLEVREEDRKIPIDELFLMTSSGLLVQHYSLKRESGLNEDVLASMLTAVRSFILDSLSMVDKKGVEDKDLSIDMGRFSVMMASGRTINLVAITDKDQKEPVMGQLGKGLEAIERAFGHVMENWDGDMDKVAGVQPFVESLVKGEFDEKKLVEAAAQPPAPVEKPPVPMPTPMPAPMPVPPGESPELPSGMRTMTITLPDPIKVPDTTKALPEKSEVPLKVTPEEPKGANILAALDDILIDIPGSGGGNERISETPEPVPPAPVLPTPPGDADMFRLPLDALEPERKNPPPPGI